MTKAAATPRRIYFHSMIVAAIIFALGHATQLLVRGLVTQESFQIDMTGFLVLVPYAAIEGVVFFVIGYAIAYFPSRIAIRHLEEHRSGAGSYVLFGVIIGVIFLPVCASVPFLLIRFPDEPGYLSRCFEFALPMMIAGAFGGFFYWRRACRIGITGVSDGFARI